MLNADYHVHSSFSDGQADYVEILNRAKELKLDEIAITDHFDRYDANPRTNSITVEELIRHFDNIRSYGNSIGQKVFCGIETCTDYKGNLRISDRVYNCCDLIITSPHYVEYEGELAPGDLYNEGYWNAYKEKVVNMAGSAGDILGHCEAYLPYGKLMIPGTTTFEQRKEIAHRISDMFFDDNYIRALIQAVKKSGKAIELHCATSTPREAVIARMIAHGVFFSIGSDAHSLAGAGGIAWGIDVLKKYHAEDLQWIINNRRSHREEESC